MAAAAPGNQTPVTETRSLADTERSRCTIDDLTEDELKQLKKATTGDQVHFIAGVANMMTTAFIVGRWPWHFWIVHIVKAFVYLPWRFVRFRRRNMEFYLLDFCYVATYCATIACLMALFRVTFGIQNPLHSHAQSLFRAGFFLSTGPLAWSILLFRNSIVFHSVDQLTSVFIHLSPALLFWCLRWGGGLGTGVVQQAWPDMFDVCHSAQQSGDFGAVDECASFSVIWCTNCFMSWQDFVLWPLGIWFGWAVLYYILVFCLLDGYITRNNKSTLFSWLISEPSLQQRFILAFPEALHRTAYLLLHLAVTAVFGSLSVIFWHSFPAHTLFMVFIIFTAQRNGASYFFRIFAVRYANQLIEKKISPLRQRSQQEDLPAPADYGSMKRVGSVV